MKAKFIGDPSDDFSGPRVLNHAGTFFPKDRFVGVSDEVAAKLAGNNHFEVAKGDAEAYEPSAAEVAATAPKPAEAPAGKGLDQGRGAGALEGLSGRRIRPERGRGGAAQRARGRRVRGRRRLIRP
jgi:hypothetical protein